MFCLELLLFVETVQSMNKTLTKPDMQQADRPALLPAPLVPVGGVYLLRKAQKSCPYSGAASLLSQPDGALCTRY